VPFAAALGRALEISQCASQRIKLAFIGEFLALGEFDEFQHFLHLFGGALQSLDNLLHLAHRRTDGGRLGGLGGWHA
jgi:hypothetical protein